MKPLQLTRFTSKRTLAKRLKRLPDGSHQWYASANLSEGRADTLTPQGLDGLADLLLNTLTPRQAIALGVIADGRTTARIAPKDAIDAGTAPAGAIARATGHFTLPEQGFLFLDVDDGMQPEAVIEHLEAFDESLKGTRWLAVASSRYHITDRRGRTVTRKGGWHLYAQAKGLQHLQDYAKAYEAWAKANGHAHQVRSSSGHYLWRYPIDTAVWKGAASRLIFESVALPSGYQAEKPTRWINPDGHTVTLRTPESQLLFASRQHHHPAPEQTAFNDAADMPSLLERLGYRAAGRGLWFTPGQTGNQPAAQLYPDGRIFHRGKELNGQNLDALGLVAVWEFGGDWKAAAAAVRASAGGSSVDVQQYLQRIQADRMAPAAQRAMAAYARTDEEEWLGMAALYDGAGQRCSVEQWAHQYRQSPRVVDRLLEEVREARWGGQHLARGIKRQHLANISDVVQRVRENPESIYLQAPLGAGKTDKAIARLVAQHANVLVLNHLRSLSGDLADRLGAQHYLQAEPLQPGRLVTTVHSLGSSRVLQWLDDSDPTLVVIDEAAGVADVLGQPGGNMTDSQRLQALQILQTLRNRGVRFVLADGDCPQTAQALAGVLGVGTYYTAPGEYAQPRVEIHQGVTVETIDERHRRRHTATAPLVDAIKSTSSMVLFCDTRSDVDAWAERLGCLGIHGENSGDVEQSLFLDAPDRKAPDLQRMVYNSVLGAGVSITSVERDVMGIYTGHLSPRATWQALRRWRRAAGGVIRIQATPGSYRPKRQQSVTEAMTWLEALQELQGAPGIGSPLAALQAMESAYQAEADRWQRNPQQALIAYLQEAGIDVDVIFEQGAASSDAEHAATKKQQKAQRVAEFAQAEQIDDRELGRIKRLTRKTRQQAMQERRATAERLLHLDNSDFTPAGHIREPLAKAILQKQLERRALLASYTWADGYAAYLLDEEGGGRYHHLRWQIVQATLQAVGIEPTKPKEAGRHSVTNADVATLIERLDGILPRKGRLPFLRAAGLPDLPGRRASKRQLDTWTREWFTRMGLERIGRRELIIEGQRVCASIWRLEAMAAHYGQRIAAHREDRNAGDAPCDGNRAGGRATPAFPSRRPTPAPIYSRGGIAGQSCASESCDVTKTLQDEAKKKMITTAPPHGRAAQGTTQ